jgi:hypothetical protein
MTESNTTTVLDAVREMTVHALANNVSDISGPDEVNSPGAQFLDRVRDAVIESLEWKTQNDDVDLAHAARRLREDSHELADGAVPIYTFNRWETFVDLGAWQVDIEEYRGGGEDMTQLAGIALYEVARTLTDSLCEYVETYFSELEDEGEQDDTEDEELDSTPGE